MRQRDRLGHHDDQLDEEAIENYYRNRYNEDTAAIARSAIGLLVLLVNTKKRFSHRDKSRLPVETFTLVGKLVYFWPEMIHLKSRYRYSVGIFRPKTKYGRKFSNYIFNNWLSETQRVLASFALIYLFIYYIFLLVKTVSGPACCQCFYNTVVRKDTGTCQ
jgi:hypothetical protein